MPSSPIARQLFRFAAIALSYAVVGRLGLLLVVAPELASPLYPAAGLALAVVAVYGLGVAPAIALGAFAANLWHTHGANWQLPLLAACSATAQAALGGVLVRRYCRQPLTLQTSGDLLRFYGLGIGLAGLLSPSIATLGLHLLSPITSAQAWDTWGTWWVGDTVGAMIGAPAVLTVLGRPAAAWRRRRFTVGLPLLIATTLVGLGTYEVRDWDRQRSMSEFERDAGFASASLEEVLRQPQGAIKALQGLAQVRPRPTNAEFEAATAPLLDGNSPLLALGLLYPASRAQLPALDAAARADGMTGFTSRDRGRSGDLTTSEQEDMLVIRHIAPLARNALALGVNIRSIPVPRDASSRAISSGRLVASAGFQLSQSRGPAIGVVLYQALYADSPNTPEERERLLRNVAFATLQPEQLLRRLTASWPSHLSACIVDQSATPTPERLAGQPGCEAGGDSLHAVHRRLMDMGGRQWLLMIADQPKPRPDSSFSSSRSWPFALVGLSATALIGALMLLVSGRAQQVEEQVRLRTAELRREVQERSHSELALRESEERFRNIFEHAPLGIVFLDLEGRYQHVNPRFCALLGRESTELTGRRAIDFVHPDDREDDDLLGRQLLRGEMPVFRRSRRFLRPDGGTVQTRVSVSLLRGTDGRPNRFIGVVEDVTDELRAQEADRVRRAAEAANRAKTEFLSRMSHELRTPMNAILGFTQLMLLDGEEPLPPGQRTRVEQISTAGWHLLEMINDTLDLSRIEAGVLRVERSVQHLPSLLARAHSLVQGMAMERQVRIDVEVATGSATVWGDATRIVQVLTNLLSNAVKYNHVGGWVHVTVRRPDNATVEVKVRDSGAGLSPEQRLALFQPFNRLGREQGSVAGTGIGLVISRRLAEMMGGGLDAADVTPPGACFVFTLRSSAESASNTAE